MTETEEHILHDSKLIRNVLPPELSNTIFEDLQAELEPHWSEMGHKGGVVPRLVCIQGTIDADTGAWPLYRHPADEQPPLLHWTPTVEKLVKIVSLRLQQPINHALIQCYRGGHDFISQHADKTLDIQRDSNIVNLSIGARRTMVLRPKKDDVPKGTTLPATPFPMEHGSLFVLGWETNRLCTHEIKRDKRLESLKHPAELNYGGCRISLTLRTVATFSRVDGTLYGQGAPKKEILPSSAAEEDALLKAFSIENRRTDYDWDEIYGRGFNIVNFQIVNGNKTIDQEVIAEDTMDQVSTITSVSWLVLKHDCTVARLTTSGTIR